MKNIFRLIIVLFLFNCQLSFAQYVQRFNYRIESVPGWTYGRENQYAMDFVKLSDGGFSLAGYLEFWDESHIQDREFGKNFMMKIDSNFIFNWVDTGDIDGDRLHKHMSVVETVDGVIAVFDTLVGSFYYINYLHVDSLNGSNAWSKVINVDSNSTPIIFNKIFEQNDTLYASGVYVDYNISQSIPIFLALKSNGDTIFKKEYYSILNSSSLIELQKDVYGNYYLVLQNNSTNVILHIDLTGNVHSIDTLPSLLPFPTIKVISPSKFLMMDNINQSCYKILNNQGLQIDSMFVRSFILDFYAGNNGNTFAFCLSTPNDLFGDGYHIFNIDSHGDIKWSIRVDSTFVNCIKEIDSKIYASGSGGNSVDLLILNPPSNHVTINSSAPQICAGDSVLLTATEGMHYYWTTGDTVQNIYVKSGGSYRVFVVDSMGGGTFSDTLNIAVDPCLGIDNYSSENSDLKISPNPASNEVRISWTPNGIKATVELRNIENKLLFSCRTSSGELKIDTSMLEDGNYLIMLKEGNKMSSTIITIVK